MRTLSLLFSAITVLLVVGCNENSASVSTLAEQPASTLSVSNEQPSGELTDSLILQKIYGQVLRQPLEYGINHPGDFVGKVTADAAQFTNQHWESLGMKNGFVLEYKVENKWQISTKGPEKWLVVLGSYGESCHICPGVCAGAVLVKNGNDWQLETYENDIAVIGASGVPVDVVEFAPCGKNAFAIVLEVGSVWQGTSQHYFSVVLYKDGKFSEALLKPVDYAMNNWNHCTEVNSYVACYGYTSTIYFKPHTGDIWDMVVHFQGTQLSENGRGPVLLNRKVRFKYENGQYDARGKLPGE